MAEVTENGTPALEDIEMEQGDKDVEVDDAADQDAAGDALPDAPEPEQKSSFLDSIRSQIVELAVGPDGEVVSVHRAYLDKSPWFAEACAGLVAPNNTIYLPDEDMDTVGCVLEYLYTGEYFPRRKPGSKQLELDPRYPTPDIQGESLLRHARIYNLANKLQLPALKSLAHVKIHGTTSTARGEIAFARYVYATTTPDEDKIRTPIAAFWATRSHTLRHEAEDEFRAMCMEFPQFGFDVLSRVLDQREKDTRAVSVIGTPASAKGKKRLRASAI